MKDEKNKKSVRVEFVMSEQEAELVKGRMYTAFRLSFAVL